MTKGGRIVLYELGRRGRGGKGDGSMVVWWSGGGDFFSLMRRRGGEAVREREMVGRFLEERGRGGEGSE